MPRQNTHNHAKGQQSLVLGGEHHVAMVEESARRWRRTYCGVSYDLWRKAVLYGFLIWLIPFVTAILIGPIRQSWRTLFESIMPAVVTLVVAVAAVRYLRRVEARQVREGALLGLLWWLISVIIDLPLMLNPPMSMTLKEYMADVGLTYVVMPIVTIALAVALSHANRAYQERTLLLDRRANHGDNSPSPARGSP